MYKLPHFTEENEDIIFEFMQKNSFAIITGHDGNFPIAAHVPLDIKREGGKIILTGHVMKHTDHCEAFRQNENVLVIFSGPHCYVSASWYDKKNVASTWNYMEVNAKGKIRMADEEETKIIIEDITNYYEGHESEASFNKITTDYVDRLVKAIIGFKIEVETIENVFKLSQNKDSPHRKNIIEQLEKLADTGSHAIAAEMRKRL